MPEARLRRTREAYPEMLPLTTKDLLDYLAAVSQPIVDEIRIVTDQNTGVTTRERVPQKFKVR